MPTDGVPAAGGAPESLPRSAPATPIDDAIAGLVARHRLEPRTGDQLRALVDVVATDPLAPTTVTAPRRIIEEHIADSLVALELPAVRLATRIADLGSGAGFPGLPLAIALPHASVALVESAARKCAFIERAAAAAQIANADAVHARAEEWLGGLAAHDLVTARALSAPEVVLEYAAPLLTIGGASVLWRGRRDAAAEAAAARAAEVLGLEVGPVIAVDPFPAAEHRHLHVFTKVAATPARFPRRAGMARKRPLGHNI